MTPSHLWQKASAFAARKHRDQFRQDKLTPYFSHPVRVALTVSITFGCTDETVLAAALLHDVIEDTTADYDDLLEEFGKEIADIVACLSKDKRLVEPVREERYHEQLRGGRWKAKLIKLADVYDNFTDAPDDESRRSFANKARRAIDVVKGEPQLTDAVTLVEQLIRTAETHAASA